MTSLFYLHLFPTHPEPGEKGVQGRRMIGHSFVTVLVVAMFMAKVQYTSSSSNSVLGQEYTWVRG